MMTNQEVIERLKRELHCYCSFTTQQRCEDCSLRITRKKAIEALEKQIPKKPDYEDVGDYRCPACGTLFGDDGLMEHYCFCPDCGQKIDWSD